MTACWARLSADAGLIFAFGKMDWLAIEEMPAGAEYPLATIEQVSSKTEQLTFSGGYESEGEITVACYATTQRQAAALAQAVRDALRLVSVTIQGRTTSEIFVDGGESEYLGRGQDGDHVYVESVDFSVTWPGELPT